MSNTNNYHVPIFADRQQSSDHPEAALLGTLTAMTNDSNPRDLFLLTHRPFVLAIVGDSSDGRNRAHAVACIVEACHVPLPTHDVIRLRSAMDSLVLFRSHDPAAPPCAAAGLATTALAAGRVTVLTSPWYFAQRAEIYGSGTVVRPLRLCWQDLTVDEVGCIVGVERGGAAAPAQGPTPAPAVQAAAGVATRVLSRGAPPR